MRSKFAPRGGDLALVYAVTLLTQVAVGTLPPLLPDLQREFGVSVAELSLVVAAFAASRLILDLPVGAVLDRMPVVPTLVASAMVVAVGGLLGAVSDGVETMALSRALMGAGSTVTILSTQLALSRVTTPANRGRLLGYYQAAAIAGSVASPALGGVIALLAGWRYAFVLSAFVAAATAGVVLLLRGYTAGAAGTAALNPVVENAPCAETPRHAVAGNAFAAVAAANFTAFSLHFFSSGLQETVAPLLGGLRLSLDSSALGAIASLGTVAFFAATFASGHLADRAGRGRALVAGLCVMILGLVALDLAGTILAYTVAITVMAVGRSCGCIPVVILLDHVSPARWGRAMGVNRFLSDVGMAGGPLVLGLLVDWQGYSAAVGVTGLIVLLTAAVVALGVRSPATRALRAEMP